MDELSLYHFDLPPELVSQNPPEERGDSRLMVLDKKSGGVTLSDFKRLPEYLPAEALLVFNQVKVTPARLFGHKPLSGGQLEVLLLDIPEEGSPPGDYDLWCLAKPCARLKIGAELEFGRVSEAEIRARQRFLKNSEKVEEAVSRQENERRPAVIYGSVLEKGEQGRRKIRFRFSAPPLDMLDDLGHMPLPPYIRRPDNAEDARRYQTVYAKRPGAAAAPTAGLHFTDEMLKALEKRGQEMVYLTLKVGLGTFAPLTEENLSSGRLHQEFMDIPQETALAVLKAQKEKRPVVAVGTTSARALEWAAQKGSIEARQGRGDLFIRPGYEWKAVDGLITNFHLPSSSLLMMVSALAGRKHILTAYEKAILARYKFFSYGEAMLII